MTTINVLGWYNKNNIGDESYKLSFPIVFPNYNFSFKDHYSNSKNTVVLGGGNVLNQKFIDVFHKLNCHKLCLSVGATEKHTILCDQIYVRDIQSLEYIPNSKYMPDLAFALTPNKENGKKLLKSYYQQKDLDLYEKVVVVIPNAHLKSNVKTLLAIDYAHYENFCFQFSRLIDSTSASFVFLPFCRSAPSDDRACAYDLASKCFFWKKNLVITEELSVQETLDIVSCADIVISQRLHGSIFSCISGVPFIDITHHDKNKSFLKTIQKEDLMISYWQFSPQVLQEKINHFFLNKESENGHLNKITLEQKAILKEVAHDICFCQ